jgi:hypothetical protein
MFTTLLIITLNVIGYYRIQNQLIEIYKKVENIEEQAYVLINKLNADCV